MATNIKVTLEADISKYQQGLKDATAAADKFTQTVGKGTAAAEQGFAKVAASAGAVTGAMSKIATAADAASMRANNLVTALSGLAAGAFINSLLQGASASKDMSEAFGLSITSVLELQSAFATAGRGPEKMNQMLATLSDTAVGALQGNYALRASFERLGISMADLQNKSAKEIISDIAKVMTSGNVSAAQLSATYDILGRAAKGLPWGDFKDKLEAVNGTMGPAAEATKTFDEIMKKLEATAGAVKKEFIVLVAPVAEFLNTFTSSGENARVIALGIAAAMTTMAGAAVVSGIQSIAGAIKALTGWLGSLATVTTTATAATGTYVATAGASAAQSIVQAAGLSRVATATMALNVAEIELNTLMAQGAFTAAAHASAIDKVAAAELRLVTMTEAAAATQAQLAASMGATAATGARIGGIFATLSGAVAAVAGVLGAPIWATIGVILAGIAAAVAALTVVWKAFGPEVKALAATIGDYLVNAFKTFVGWLDTAAIKLREFFGLKPNPELSKQLETNAEYLKRMGIEASKAGGGRGGAGMPQAMAGEGVAVVSQGVTGNLSVEGDRAVAAGTAALNPMAAQELGMRRQLDLLKLQNEQQEEKLKKQLELVGLGEAERAQAMAAFDFRQKQSLEVFRLETEIAKMQAQAANEVGGGAKYGAQIEALKKQRDYVKEQVDDTSALVGDIQRATQAEQNRLYMIESQVKVKNQLKGIDQSIADFNLSEDNRRLAAIQNQIALEQEAAVKKRQDQLGNQPIAEAERLAIMEKIAAIYNPLIAKQREYNEALAASEATKFALDLQNKAIENQITLTAELSKLTQSADQQRITDLNTQLELMARQEIVRRESKLAPGQTLGQDEQAAIRKQVFDANQGLMNQTQLIIAKSRDFETAWSGAFEQYKSDAFNGAMEAKTYFDTFTKGFEDAFVKFVQTGKLSFKDLANTMIAEFARIQAKKLASGILDFDFKGSFGGGGGLGGLFGGGGGIFGAIGDFFGGLFADGGTLGAGKWGIAGEKGPELIQGPANVIPMDKIGGNTSNTAVTYNIQAVDAASFQQLVARDPKFLHAVVEKGRRSIPQGAMR